MFLEIIACHHLAGLVMSNGNHWDRFLYPTLTLMIDSYNVERESINKLASQLPGLEVIFFYMLSSADLEIHPHKC